MNEKNDDKEGLISEAIRQKQAGTELQANLVKVNTRVWPTGPNDGFRARS